MQYQGSCHCGAITFCFVGEHISKGLRCNCSVCKRKGIMISPYVISQKELTITVKDDALISYKSRNDGAKQYFCKKCGIHTFNESISQEGNYRVNLGCLDEVNTFELEFDVFDGASL